ncbi:hypothetical protein FY557_13575 [Chryseobacterium sp. SN22]|uniref:hypothetical protein n=1 Tax=Chryseobacterium sp. SN22 TaxID=2606431 RepID=UPI0011EFAFB7|nr:hypothetical protein [Chryseobacterium sp. SN22]KAA0127400.1 hypothetical protein FY557_13575 [Chryseobacterium sp. SN22]
MKIKLLILSFLISVKLSGCKCENMSIRESFKYADFVFTGKVYDIIQVPSGFKTLNSYLSKIKVNTIYKSEAYGEFYKKDAVLFSSPLRSCDLSYDKNTEYLIFGYIEPDTGLLYSEFCTYTRPLKNVTKDELKILQDLGKEYVNQDEDVVLKPFIEDFELEPNKPDIYIKKLKRKADLDESRYEALKTEHRNLKILLFAVIGMLIVGISLMFWKGNNKFR